DSSSAVMRPSRWRMRPLRLPLAAFQATTETTRSDFPRPTILGRTLPAVEALALSPDLRPSRYRRPLAARAISQVLCTSFQEEPATSRQTRDGSRDSTSD